MLSDNSLFKIIGINLKGSRPLNILLQIYHYFLMIHIQNTLPDLSKNILTMDAIYINRLNVLIILICLRFFEFVTIVFLVISLA